MKQTGTVQLMLDALRDYGPMTRVDLEELLGLTKAQTSRLMECIIYESKRLPQRAHIKAYVYDQEGQKRYPRALYAFGPGVNAAKPKRDQQAVQKRSRAKKKRLIATNSVFNLAMGIPYAARALNRIKNEQQAQRG